LNDAKLYDDDVIEHYRAASATGEQFRGMSIVKYERDIGVLIAATRSTRLLDYGSGVGDQYKKAGIHKRWGVPMPYCYDPGVDIHYTRPTGTFDGVLCSDVLEHVPEELVDNVLHDVFSFAEKWVWLSVCCRPAKKFFEDGRNLHLTVRRDRWWVKRIRDASGGKKFYLVFTP